MLETLGLTKEAAAIDAAVLKAVRENQVTPDIGGTLGTREAGDFIAAADTLRRPRLSHEVTKTRSHDEICSSFVLFVTSCTS